MNAGLFECPAGGVDADRSVVTACFGSGLHGLRTTNARTEPFPEIQHAVNPQFRRDPKTLEQWFQIRWHRASFAAADLSTCPVQQLQIITKPQRQTTLVRRSTNGRLRTHGLPLRLQRNRSQPTCTRTVLDTIVLRILTVSLLPRIGGEGGRQAG